MNTLRYLLATALSLFTTVAYAEYWGHFPDGGTLTFYTSTIGQDGEGATPTGETIAVYKDGSDTELTTGATIDDDVDSVIGFHRIAIDTTQAGFDEGSLYTIIYTAGTSDGVALAGRIIGSFYLGPKATNVIQFVGNTTPATQLAEAFDDDGIGGDFDVSTLSVTGGTELSNPAGPGLSISTASEEPAVEIDASAIGIEILNTATSIALTGGPMVGNVVGAVSNEFTNVVRISTAEDLEAVVEAQTTGTLCLAAPGVHAMGADTLVIPTGVTLRGAGRDVTVITSTNTSAAIVRPGNNSCVEDLTIQSLNVTEGVFDFPLGATTGSFTNAVCRNLRVIGRSDGIYVTTATPCSARFENVITETKYDSWLTFGAAHSFTWDNCEARLTVDNETDSGAAVSLRGVNGYYKLNNCRLRVENPSGGTATSMIGVYTHASDAVRVELFDCEIALVGAASSSNFVIDHNSSGLFQAIGCDFDRTKVDGTIVDIRGGEMGLVADAITASKFDESSAFPLVSADSSTTRIARTGADSDTLETLSDEIAGVSAGTSPNLLQTTTITGLSTQTVFNLTAGSADNDAYNDQLAVIVDSVTSEQKASIAISDYVGATKTVTLAATPIFTIADGDTIHIIAAPPATVSGTVDAQVVGVNANAINASALAADAGTEIGDAVLNNPYADNVTPGTLGGDLSSAPVFDLDVNGHVKLQPDQSQVTDVGGVDYSGATVAASGNWNTVVPPSLAEFNARTLAAASYATAAAQTTQGTILSKVDAAFISSGVFSTESLVNSPVGEGGGLDAAGVRAAIGMAAANLDTQMAAKASQVSVDDIPTNAEAAADQAILVAEHNATQTGVDDIKGVGFVGSDSLKTIKEQIDDIDVVTSGGVLSPETPPNDYLFEFTNNQQISSPKFIIKAIGFKGPLGFDLSKCIPGQTIQTVTAVTIAVQGTGQTAPVVSNALIDPATRKGVNFDLDTTGDPDAVPTPIGVASTGRYTITVTVVTSHGYTEVKKGTLVLQ